MSRQTASEKLETIYTTNAEWDRIIKEEKRKMAQELQAEIQRQKAAAGSKPEGEGGGE